MGKANSFRDREKRGMEGDKKEFNNGFAYINGEKKPLHIANYYLCWNKVVALQKLFPFPFYSLFCIKFYNNFVVYNRIYHIKTEPKHSFVVIIIIITMTYI